MRDREREREREKEREGRERKDRERRERERGKEIHKKWDKKHQCKTVTRKRQSRDYELR